MKNHFPGPGPVSVLLPINRSIIGQRRAAWVFQACRYAAQQLDPDVHIQAVYENYERTGYTFRVRDRLTAMRLHHCHQAVMQGRPLPLPR